MDRLISHERPDPADLEAAVQAAAARAAQAGPEFGSREQLLADLELWAKCELGAWMLTHGGWNGYWTQYCVTYPQRLAAGEAPPDNEVERFFLTSAPAVRATQQRARHFQALLDELVPPAAVAMSLPCGAMADLLAVPDVAHGPGAPAAPVLVGADLDPQSLDLAWDATLARGRDHRTVLLQGDAWVPESAQVRHGAPGLLPDGPVGRVDVLTSNGLNIYVPEDARVVELYRSFRRLVRPGGHLVTSALTPATQWDEAAVDPADAQRSRGLLMLSNVMWANMRPAELTVAQLRDAGFEVLDIRYDDLRAFPTFLARARADQD